MSSTATDWSTDVFRQMKAALHRHRLYPPRWRTHRSSSRCIEAELGRCGSSRCRPKRKASGSPPAAGSAAACAHHRHAVLRRRQLHQRAGAAHRLPGALPDAGDDAWPVGRVQSVAGAEGHLSKAVGVKYYPVHKPDEVGEAFAAAADLSSTAVSARPSCAPPHYRRQGVRTKKMHRLQIRVPCCQLMYPPAHRGESLIVTGLGNPTWDCFAAADNPDYLYSVGRHGSRAADLLGVDGAAEPPHRTRLRRRRNRMGIGSLAVGTRRRRIS